MPLRRLLSVPNVTFGFVMIMMMISKNGARAAFTSIRSFSKRHPIVTSPHRYTPSISTIISPHHFPQQSLNYRLSSTPLFSTTSTESSPKTPTIPITLLSGFLGAGKTTALKNLLQNREGLKIGVIVNDVASVNIDAKLIADPSIKTSDDTSDDKGTVELQNGCACCSLADELLTSITTLCTGRDFDAVVVELSGVADPMSVKSNWDEARRMNHPATKMADVSTVVTVIDSCTFGTDYMTWNTVGDRDGWLEEGEDCGAQRKIPELLAEQVEAADVLLMNKVDLAGSERLTTASKVAKGLNDKAKLFETTFGEVSASELIRMMNSGVLEKKDSKCDDPDCTDASHSHKHDHKHDAKSCEDPDCTDTSHSHSHDHKHDAKSCEDPACTDTSHSHSHDHDAACSDPDCTDTSHSHDHSHTSTDDLGISSFVYKSPRPFNAPRLMNILNNWPVPIKDDLPDLQILSSDDDDDKAEMTDDLPDSPFLGVLRSKGFCWLAPTNWTPRRPGDIRTSDSWRHDTAMYWSHAGKHFGITTAGKWWGTIDKETMKQYFTTNRKEYERILKEDWASEEFGDRRQEIVFIGVDLDEDEIRRVLDDCLLTDDELEGYRSQVRNIMDATMTVSGED